MSNAQLILHGYLASLIPAVLGGAVGVVICEIHHRKHLQLLRDYGYLVDDLETGDESGSERILRRDHIGWFIRLKLRHARLQLRVLRLKLSNARLQFRIGRHERTIARAEPAKCAVVMPGNDSPKDCSKSGN